MHDLRAIADKVAREIAYAKRNGSDELVVTPLLYPSGSVVIIRLDQGPNGFFVSDYGSGAREVSMMGDSERTFRRLARKVAEAYSIRFTDDLFFDVEVPEEALVAAVITVANASKFCVEQTALAVAAAEHDSKREILASQLQVAFRGAAIEIGAQFVGASERWDFDAIVRSNDRPVLFDIVAPRGGSVNAAVAKFLDISDLGRDATRRVAVAVDRANTPRVALLTRNASIVDLLGSREQYASLAA